MPSVKPKNHNEVFVTIGIPAFNRGDKIGRTIESLLSQTHCNFELLITDDASTDTTQQVCEYYAELDHRIIYIRQKENAGMKANFQVLVDNAKGEYCVWAGDDDIYHPEFVSTLVTALVENPTYGAALSSIHFVTPEGKSHDGVFFKDSHDVTNFTPKEIFRAAILKQPPVHFFTTGLFRTEIMRRFHPRYLGPGLDKAAICELSFTVKLYSVPEVLYDKMVYPFEQYRYGPHLKKFYGRSRNWYFILILTKTLYTSPYITFTQKIFILPPRLIWAMWIYRRGLVVEIFPWARVVRRFIKKQRNPWGRAA